MRLKSLELHGFKSFPDRTKINFTSGVTVIVGPNGSGKSNISDAIRWVLGELSSKNVRGNKMEDVIFGGTEKRPAMGYAEVSLTIDNCGENRIATDYDEITVTRRLYRSGDSEYLINNKAARLRDILDMFMNTGIGKTGYSIIGQGKISEIISQKSEERRIIFEEAAGISKYRVKKQDSERRLAETENNLVRLTDILSEIEGRVGPLEKEAAKAKIYLELFEKKKAIEVALLLYDIAKVNIDKETLEKDCFSAKNELDLIEEAIAGLDRMTDNLTNLQLEKKQRYEECAEKYSKLSEERHAADNELTLLKNELAHLDGAHADNRGAAKRAAETLEAKRTEHGEITLMLHDAEAEMSTLTSAYNENESELDKIRGVILTASEAVDALEEKKASLQTSYNDLRVSISAADATQISQSTRYDEIKDEINASKERLSSLNTKKTVSRKTADEYTEKLNLLKARLEKQLLQADAVKARIGAGESESSALLSEIAAKEQRALTLKRMEEHLEGYSGSVRFIADAAKNGILKGICGPVSKLISVKEELGTAIETALGANVQNIIVEDENAAKAAIAHLKRNNAGRSTFYPLTTIRAQRLSTDISRLSSYPGFYGIASELVGYDARYSDVICYLLGRTVVFDDINNASAASRAFGFSFKAVTLDGQIINAGGSYTGGSVKQNSGILTRSAEINAILAEKAALESRASLLDRNIAKYKEELGSLKNDCDGTESDISLAGALIKAEETSLSILERSITDEAERLALCNSSLEHMLGEDEESKNKLAVMKERCAETELLIRDLNQKAEIAVSDREKADAELDRLISAKNSAYLALSLKKKDIENRRQRLSENELIINELENELSSLAEKADALVKSRAVHTARCRELEALTAAQGLELGEIESGNKALSSETLELEREINELRVKSRDKGNKKISCATAYNSLASRLERITADKDKLTDRLFEEYELTYAAAEEMNFEPVNEDNRAKKGSELNKYKSKIRELGAVNVNSIDEYKEVKERFEFLSGQVSDLVKAKADFNRVIGELEKEMCERFTETFTEVNRNFKGVFAELFGGGSANLSLSDPDNVLTSGIEIEVAPPGKIIKNLKLLSGGEQVFVAIAVFFAILKVNPSPFCLLDEIESALDEVNVDRFASYAKMYSDNTQFIVITHRRGSMEVADTLYGITMQEKGISRVLHVNLGEIEQKTGVKL